MHKRIISLLCALVILFGCIAPTYSCYYADGSMTQEEMDRDVSYWRQGHVPADNSLIHSGTDRTIGRAACSHFAMSYALVKMGYLNPAEGDTPITHIELAREYHAFRVNWGYYEYGKAPEMYPGIEYVGVDYNTCGLGAADGLAYVKGKMAEGYYVIACVSSKDTGGHMIFFDGINEDGTVSIGDSAFYGTTWEEYYGIPGTNTKWDYLELLKCEGAPFNEQPSIYDENALREANEEEITQYETLVKEKDLTGMPTTSNLSEYALVPDLPDFSALLQYEKDSLAAIKDSHDASQVTLFQVLGAVASFVGVLMILYAVALILGFIFDYVNAFVDIDFVRLLTFGFIKVVRDPLEYDKRNNRQGYVTILKLFIIIFVIASVGVFLVSGGAVAFLYSIVERFVR